MNRAILAGTSIGAAFLFASCGSAQPGETAVPADGAGGQIVAGEPVQLEGGSPFAAASHGTFDAPWAIAVHPQDGRLFITEKGGTMKFYDPASGQVGTVTGLPEVDSRGQGGLGDIAFAPDFARSGTIYLSWAENTGGDSARAAAGRGQLVCDSDDACRVDGLSKIWEQSRSGERTGHYSHKFAFSPDGDYLFISSGDRQEGEPAQDLSNNLGSVVRLLPDGTPAPANPFADRSPPTNQIWTYGQRSILGLQFDPDGELWALEHGPAGGDELNHLVPGNNYGWPERSAGNHYDGTPIPDHSPDDGFAKPAIGWTPVIAPGDFLFYTGEMWGDWQGQALIANLGVPSIVRVETAADNASAIEEGRYFFPNRLRDIAQGPDGSLWLIEDGPGGRLLRLTPGGS